MAGKFQSSSGKQTPKQTPKPTKYPVRSSPEPDPVEPLNHEQARIQEWLKKTRFRKAVLGGVDEADVWKKIGELNTLYEAALSAERARYDALLAERTGAAKQEDTTEHGRVWDE